MPHPWLAHDAQALIINPTQPHQHQQTFIILHGRGSHGEKFGHELIQTPLPAFHHQTLPQIFPNAKFLFPTAPRRRAQLYKRALTHQWFDNWALDTPREREELQFDGLRVTARELHLLIRNEVELVGHENVVLWGLSQGCAAALIALLVSSAREKVAGVVGMCGWLPLRARMEEVVNQSLEGVDDGDDGDDDPFATTDQDLSGELRDESKLERVVRYLDDELDVEDCLIDSTRLDAIASTPVFLGHGSEDDRVSIRLGREAAGLLGMLDFDVEAVVYEGLGHWYSGEMLSDIVDWISRKTTWSVVWSS